MSRFVSAGIAAIAVASLAACSTDSPVANNGPAISDVAFSANVRGPEQVMPGEMIVKLKDASAATEVASAHGLAVGERGYNDAFVVMRGAAGSEHANVAALKGDSRVEYAEPNYLRQIDTIDSRLWAFFNPGGLNMLFTTGSSKGKPLPASYASTADADEDNIENYAGGGADVVIGSIDTGVLLSHGEFSGAN